MIDIWGRDKITKMTTIKYNSDKSLYFNLPIIFMFTRNIDSYLPLQRMNRSNMKIKFNTSQLSDMIVNYNSGNLTGVGSVSGVATCNITTNTTQIVNGLSEVRVIKPLSPVKLNVLPPDVALIVNVVMLVTVST